MRIIWHTLAVALFLGVSVGAFVHDQMTQAIGDLGPQLLKAVSLTGEVLSSIARPSADELINNRREIQRRLTDLKEQTEAILQILREMEMTAAPLQIYRLDEGKKAVFLRLVPPESRADIERTKTIEMKVVLEIYADVKSDVQHDASSFNSALSEIKDSSDMRAVNNVGITRGALTASLGRLVNLSGTIQQLAYLSKGA
jgi:hypothetical protein